MMEGWGIGLIDDVECVLTLSPKQTVEKVHQRCSRYSKTSPYTGVRLGLLAACGLAGRPF